MIDVARWLRQEADPGRWTGDDLEAMCTARGWRIESEQVRTGMPTGDGVLHTAPGNDTYIALSLPLSGPHPDAAAASAAFRHQARNYATSSANRPPPATTSCSTAGPSRVRPGAGRSASGADRTGCWT